MKGSKEMKNDVRRIAIIPARSSSKGLKDKNIKALKGKPLIAYSIDAAYQSKAFEEVFVSTDSSQYADIAMKYGADASFLRSSENSSDDASSWDVVREVIEEFKKREKVFDEVMLLQPTSPLRTAMDIKKSIAIFREKNANSVISVAETDHSPLWTNTLPDDGCMDDFMNEKYRNQPRQKLPVFYRYNGAIYLLRVSELYKETMFRDRCFAYIMPKERSIDIDSEFDFKIAGLFLDEINK